jgi:trans-aconitate methyltransferase
MSEPPVSHRFYGELAEWWPLISPPDDYIEEAAFVAQLLQASPSPVHEVLELGSGGGHNAVHLKSMFSMTLVDLSNEMLDVSRRLNPECRHQQGDMRTVRLERNFDAVFIHDAIDYMTTEADLALAIETAFVHCRPDGVAVFVPDSIRETYADDTSHEGNDAPDGRSVRFLIWEWDPDPTDTSTLTEYAFLLRDADGLVRTLHETHRLGLFGRDDWLRQLSAAGFEPTVVTEVTSEERLPREFFVGHRPPS